MLLITLFVFSFVITAIRLGLKGVIFSSFFLAIYTVLVIFNVFELSLISTDLTYGSDSRYYLNEISKCLKISCDNNVLAPNFVYLSSLFYIDGFIEGALVVVFMNAAILILCLNVLYRLSRDSSFYFYFISSVLLFNPITLWVGLRGLKEALLIFLIFFSAHFYSNFRAGKGRYYLLLVLFIAILIEGIKPLGGTFLVLAILVVLFLERVNVRSFALISFVGYLGISLGANFLIKMNSTFYRFLAHRENAIENGALEPTIFNLIVAPLRFLLGPGPFRSLVQVVEGGVYTVSTNVGDVLIFLGVSIWWLVLACSIYFLFKTKMKITDLSKFSLFCFAVSILYITSYSIIYLGTGDTRHRSVIYALYFPVFFELSRSYLNYRYLRR